MTVKAVRHSSCTAISEIMDMPVLPLTYSCMAETKISGSSGGCEGFHTFPPRQCPKVWLRRRPHCNLGRIRRSYIATMAAVFSEEEFSTVPFIGEEKLSEPVSAKVDVLVELLRVHGSGIDSG